MIHDLRILMNYNKKFVDCVNITLVKDKKFHAHGDTVLFNIILLFHHFTILLNFNVSFKSLYKIYLTKNRFSIKCFVQSINLLTFQGLILLPSVVVSLVCQSIGFFLFNEIRHIPATTPQTAMNKSFRKMSLHCIKISERRRVAERFIAECASIGIHILLERK